MSIITKLQKLRLTNPKSIRGFTWIVISICFFAGAMAEVEAVKIFAFKYRSSLPNLSFLAFAACAILFTFLGALPLMNNRLDKMKEESFVNFLGAIFLPLLIALLITIVGGATLASADKLINYIDWGVTDIWVMAIGSVIFLAGTTWISSTWYKNF